ncbi:MAG: hypothetical protein SGJ23_11145 [Alphaproteobacteria bacterium]|nr:hypothetical protein [Alphaproteobacteria bacterium]
MSTEADKAEMRGRIVKLVIVDAALVVGGVVLFLYTQSIAWIIGVAVVSMLAGALLVVLPAIQARQNKGSGLVE